MSTRIALFLFAIGLPVFGAAQAGQNYRCTNGDQVRRVEVVYPTGDAVPCEVHYFKDTEAPGTREIPWNAQGQTGFCEARADELVSDLRGWGWTCTTAARDDTDALSAGSEP